MVQNVLVFVADSLRWDALPDQVADRGVTFKTVAQAPFSAPSFATLATGLYPPQHGVHSWTDRLSSSVRTIFDLSDVNDGFYQEGDVSSDRIFQILRRERKAELNSIDPPFVHLERNLDPHVPFGGTDIETSDEYFESRGEDLSRIRREYDRGVEISADLFAERLDTLEERGLLDETLVVFTSDHGELLGEHGALAHSSPLCPELAYVPTVFVGGGVTADDFHADPESDVIEHVDIVETLLSALGRGDELDTAGTDLLTESRPREWAFSHVNLHRGEQSTYGADSIWWHDGGHVVHRSPTHYRAAMALSRIGRGPTRHIARRQPLSLLRTYLGSTTTYGTLPVPTDEAERRLDQFRDSLDEVESEQVELDDDVEESLRDMGYL